MSPGLPLKGRALGWLVAALLGLHVWMAASVSRSHSLSADEIAHITAGYAYWTRNDYRFQPENGNLPQRVGALPLLFTDARYPEPDQAWKISDVWVTGYHFFYTAGNDAAAMLQLSRAFMALLGAMTGLAVFLWARRLWGVGGGLISLTLWSFCPNALAHAGLVTSDMAATGAFLGAATLCWWSMQRITLGRILAAGAATGLLSISKFSAPLLAPVVVVLLLVRLGFGPPDLPTGSLRIRGTFAKLVTLAATQVAVVLVALIVLWSAYGWRQSIYANGEKLGQVRNLVGWDVLESEATLPLKVVLWARDHFLLPEAYVYGFAHSYRFSRHRHSFLNGEYREDGWPTFFPYTTWVKTPPSAWLLLLGIGTAGLLRILRPSPCSRDEATFTPNKAYLAAPLLVFGYIYACSALSSGLNIGHRHVLPLYPLLYILLGATWPLIAAVHRLGKIAVLVLVGGFAVESVAARPSYLSYFNLLDGGPREAYRHVVDSSLDWGQDLPALKTWLDQLSPRSPVFLSYFGSADPVGEGIHAVRIADGDFDWHPRLPLVEMKPGTYCISATMLQQDYSLARGPWDSVHRARLDTLEKRFVQEAGAGRSLSRSELTELEQYRFAKLCAHLRSRNPDARVAASFLVYIVGPEEFASTMSNASANTKP